MSLTARLQAELDYHMMKLLDVLQWLGGLKTKKELLNNALTLLRWAVKERAKGNVICSVNERTHERKELEMPYLESVAGNMQSVTLTPDVIAVLGLTGTVIGTDSNKVGTTNDNTTGGMAGNTSNTNGNETANEEGGGIMGKRGLHVGSTHGNDVRVIASGSTVLRR